MRAATSGGDLGAGAVTDRTGNNAAFQRVERRSRVWCCNQYESSGVKGLVRRGRRNEPASKRGQNHFLEESLCRGIRSRGRESFLHDSVQMILSKLFPGTLPRAGSAGEFRRLAEEGAGVLVDDALDLRGMWRRAFI